MDETIIIKEHASFPNPESSGVFDTKLQEGLCLNPEVKAFDRRYFVRWMQWENMFGYYASYIIGAQWVNTDKGRLPVVVCPKMENIDYLKMFMTCFFGSRAQESLHKIYHIDIQGEPIQCPGMDSVLSPMIVVHYLSVLQRLVAKGLRRSYVRREENIRKVKGQITVVQNEMCNIRAKRYERVFCNYEEFSVNTAENQLLKAALRYSLSFLQQQKVSGVQPLLNVAHQCMAGMYGVDDQMNLKGICQMKRNKLYKEYDEALQLAKLILRHFDYAISKTEANRDSLPPFWIDLPLLYELYVYGLLDEAYPGDIVYQSHGKTGYPDFLSYGSRMILDTKYIPDIGTGKPDTYIIRQLAGYARDEVIIDELQESKEKVIPCILIYPDQKASENPFREPLSDLVLRNALPGYSHFYCIGVHLPELDSCYT